MASVLGDVAAVLIAAGIIAFVLGGIALAGALWLRRQWRRRRLAVAVRLNAMALGAAVSAVRRAKAHPLPDRRWLSLYRLRRQLLRATYGAELAVREARAASAPIGDLASLSRRLSSASVDVDRTLRIAQHGDTSLAALGDTLSHARELTETGRRIQHAAALALQSTTAAATSDLVSHVRIEERAIASTLR